MQINQLIASLKKTRLRRKKILFTKEMQQENDAKYPEVEVQITEEMTNNSKVFQ